MAFSLICFVIGTFLFAIAALLAVAEEADLAGLEPLTWFLVGIVFHSLGHWLPGTTRG